MIIFFQLAEKAGFPAGCINVLTTSKTNTPLIGKGICEHPTVKKVSFTGSTTVGKIILSNCASTVKKVQLELGGKHLPKSILKFKESFLILLY
jgi:acyl-CoA reductase-like NAD-dependent aldehyde dehydrogenase